MALIDYLNLPALPFPHQLYLKEINYAIEDAKRFYETLQDEYFYPTSEVMLLARLMYEIGYLRFAKPRRIEARLIAADEDVEVEAFKLFTDGSMVYHTPEKITVPSDSSVPIELLQSQTHIYSFVLDTSLFPKFKLDFTYTEIAYVRCFIDDRELEYSQGFISHTAEFSLEILYDGYIQIAFRKIDIKEGDTIRIVVATTQPPPADTVKVSLIDGRVESEGVALINEYEPPMSLDEMRDIILRNRNINNSLIYNEDYYNFILAHVQGIDKLKVWHEEKEWSDCAINKVFISFILKDETQRAEKEEEVRRLITNAVYGRVVVIKPPVIRKLSLSITIIDNIKKVIPERVREEVKEGVGGYYVTLTEEIIYRKVAEILKRFNTDLVIRLQRVYEPEEVSTFYWIVGEEVEVKVLMRY
jgi:hypothetical protein